MYKKSSTNNNVQKMMRFGILACMVATAFVAVNTMARKYVPPTTAPGVNNPEMRPIYVSGSPVSEEQFINTRLGVGMDPGEDFGLASFEDSKIAHVKSLGVGARGNAVIAGGNSPRVEDFYVSSNSNLINIASDLLSDFQVEKNSDYSNLTLLENKNSLNINFSQEKSIAGGINSAEPDLSLDLMNLVENQGDLGISSSYGISDLNSLPPKHEICATNDGTLIRCPEPEVELPTFSYAPGVWGSCTDGSYNRRVLCIDDQGNEVDNAECAGLVQPTNSLSLPVGQSCRQNSDCQVQFGGNTLPNGGSCNGYQAAESGGDVISPASCGAPAGYTGLCNNDSSFEACTALTADIIDESQIGPNTPFQRSCVYTPAVIEQSTPEVLGTCGSCGVESPPPTAGLCNADFLYCVGSYEDWSPEAGTPNPSDNRFECQILCEQATTQAQCEGIESYLLTDPLQNVCSWGGN